MGKLPEGVAGIKTTLSLMVKLAREGRKSYPVRRLAENLTTGLRQKDFVGEVREIHQYVKNHIRYCKDIRGTETLATPEKTLENMIGDCDDKALLASALLESIGHPTRFVALGKKPGQFTHVIVETKIGKRWIPVETTEDVPLGWYPPDMPWRLTYNV